MKGKFMPSKKMTMGLIIGNRGFFPDHLAKSGREEMIAAVQKAGMDAVVLGPEQTKYGAVETHDDAKRCAELFRQNLRPLSRHAPRAMSPRTCPDRHAPIDMPRSKCPRGQSHGTRYGSPGGGA